MVDDQPHIAVGFKRKFDRMIKARNEYKAAWEDFERAHDAFFFHKGEGTDDIELYWEKYGSSYKKQNDLCSHLYF